MTGAAPGSGPAFDAGRDLKGAIATGAGSTARYEEHHYHYGESRQRAGAIFYNIPSFPPHYRPREADLDEVKAKLLGDPAGSGMTGGVKAVGLQGMGGLGKTVLATALVHDPAIRARFPDGIAWLPFGRGVPILAKASELAFALTGEKLSFSSISEARSQLGLFTEDKRRLVVLDDVWEREAADPFAGLGPGCRVLMTTRYAPVLERMNAERHELGLLDPPAARAFLAEATDVSAEGLPTEADRIVGQCGRLPLALAAAGAMIRKGVYSWADALGALEEAALEEIDTGWLPDPEQRSLAVVLRLSVDGLGDDVRACFLDCAAFREDIDIPEAALLQLWAERVPAERRRRLVAQELVDRSLICRDDQRRYRIHNLYMDYLSHIATPLIDRHRYLVERYRTACSGEWASGPDDGYYLQHIPWHLAQAGEGPDLRALLFDPGWLHRALRVTGVNAVIGDLALLAGDREAQQLGAALLLSAHILGPGPEALAVQLCGRLLAEDGPAISKLLESFRSARPAFFGPVRNGYLTGPGAELRRFEGHGDRVNAVVVRPDGRRALSGSNDRTLRLWDLATGAELLRFEGHGGRVTALAVAVTAAGRHVLSGSEDRMLLLWSLDHGTELQRFVGHDGWVNSVVFLPDETHALSGSNDMTLRLWDLETGAELRRFSGHGGAVNAVVALPDGRRALSGADDETLRLWDLETGAELRRFVGHGGAVSAVALLPDGRRALSGSHDSTLRLWNLETGLELRRFDGHADWVRAVCVLADARRALSVSDDKTLLLWDLETGAELWRFGGHGDRVGAVSVTADGRRALSGSSDRTLRLWDIEIETARQARRFEGHDGRVNAAIVLADGARALTSSNDKSLRLWDLDTGAELRRFVGHDGWARAVAALADGRRILSSSLDQTVRLWDLETGAELRRFDLPRGWIDALAVLPDGRRALRGSNRRHLWLQNLDTGEELQRFGGHEAGIRGVCLLADGRRALSAADDKTVRLWDIETGAELQRLEGHDHWVMAVAALPDGRRAVSGSRDRTLRLWDLASGTELRRFEGHGEWIRTVAALPDGRRVLSGADDKRLILWDVETGAEISRFIGDDAITAVGVSPAGNRAVVGDNRGRVMVFDLPGVG
jgi:WD40 repeat protein